MGGPRLRFVAVASAFLWTVVIPAVAWAQSPSPLLPGQPVAEDKPWTYYMLLFVLGPLAVLALLGLVAYFGLFARRSGGAEEPPRETGPPRYARTRVTAPAVPVAAAAPRVAAPATARSAPAPAPPRPAAPAPSAAPSPKATPAPAAQPRPPATGEQEVAGPPPSTEAPAEAKPTAEAKPAEAKPTAEAKPAEPQPAPAAEAKRTEAGPDQETFDRVLKEQLDKGVDRRVAEGRARAAAVKASRQKAG